MAIRYCIVCIDGPAAGCCWTGGSFGTVDDGIPAAAYHSRRDAEDEADDAGIEFVSRIVAVSVPDSPDPLAHQTVEMRRVLRAVFDRADWRVQDSIATYTACVYGRDGVSPGEVEIVLESATEYGITAFRWAERDGGGTSERGPLTLDRDEAVSGGEDYAACNDEELDAEDLIRQIVETGYFGGADVDDIRAICKEATLHSQGYLLLPAGEFCGHPIGRLWTTNGYLQRDKYVTLDATHSSIGAAAHALLRAVTSSDEE